ncbi:hypothetical protein D3C76_1292620 [compost metagenome]
MPVKMPLSPPRVAMAMASSSREQLPARSPMPLMVTSTWVAPPAMAARLLATASPRSLWQWALYSTLSPPRILARTRRNRLPYSSGRA